MEERARRDPGAAGPGGPGASGPGGPGASGPGAGFMRSPSEPAAEGGAGTSCRGAARGFSREISRCARFSRLKFRSIRATRAPMFDELTTAADNKVASNRRR